MLALTMVGIQSCSDDLHDVGDVQVNFTATLPTDTRTRAFGKAEQVNTLIVGIFKKGVADVHTNNGGSWSYYEIDRQSLHWRRNRHTVLSFGRMMAIRTSTT